MTRELQLSVCLLQSLEAAPAEAGIGPLTRLADEARDATIRELLAEVAELRVQAARFQTAIDSLSSGVCFFDRDDRLIACNRPYAEESTELTPDDVRRPARRLRGDRRAPLSPPAPCRAAGFEGYLAECCRRQLNLAARAASSWIC